MTAAAATTTAIVKRKIIAEALLSSAKILNLVGNYKTKKSDKKEK